LTALSYLVSEPSLLVANWEDEPFVSTGLPDLGELFSLEAIEQLICSGTLPLPCVRLFRAGAVIATDRLGRPAERNAAHRERRVQGPAVLREVAAGATLVLEELQTYYPAVASFAGSLTAETGYPTYCAAFATPANSRGVAPHYDTGSVFVRQLDGSKIWRVSRPVRRWPVQEWSAGQDVDTELVLEVELRAGDCLYLPRGFIHAGTATAQASMHLSIGLVPPTWGTMLRKLTEAALDDESFREALPYGFHLMEPDKLRSMLADRISLLADGLDQLADSAAARSALAKAGPALSRPVPPAGALRAAMFGGSADR
jgi:lysine-specific demethylase/histidyl-hydroxylase NO66